MIRYDPTDGEVLSREIIYRPRTCFLMTRLGIPLPDKIKNMRRTFEKYAAQNNVQIIDATSIVTAKDFLLKIWDLTFSVPLGVAIVSEELSIPTMCNIYYELGVLQSLGKETLIIKSPGCPVPSDFVRTEYIEYGKTVGKKLNGFFKTHFAFAGHYAKMAEGLEHNPALAMDYLRRAFLISGDKDFQEQASELFHKNTFDKQCTEGLKCFLETQPIEV